MAESLVQLRIILLYTHAILMIATRLVRERVGLLSIVRAASNVPGWGLPIASKYQRCSSFDDVEPAIRVESDAAGMASLGTFIIDHGLPVVLKPDVGRGSCGVQIAFNLNEAMAKVRSSPGSTIVQRFSWQHSEYGVLYVRRFGRGRVVSIVHREAACIVADGRSRLGTLLSDGGGDPADFSASELCAIPPAGSRIRTSRIAQTDGWRFQRLPLSDTRLLCERLDRIAAGHPFFFGRFDLKSDNAESLLAGSFDVLEVNGPFSLTLAPYDTTLGLGQAYLEVRAALDHLVDVVAVSPSRARIGWATLYALLLLRLRRTTFLRHFPSGYEIEDGNLGSRS